MPIAQTRDWESNGPVISGANISLKNLYYQKFIKYGEQQFGVNLRFIHLDPGDNIQISVQGGGPDIFYGDQVAIYIKGDSFLHYRNRSWGVNLGWSDTPVYQWRITGGISGIPVRPNTPFGLFNERENDYLVGCWRPYGVNLAWSRDASDVSGERRIPRGFWNSLAHTFTEAVEAIGDTATTAVNVVTNFLDNSVGPLFIPVTYVIDIIEAFPIVGRIVEYVINFVTTIVWFVASLPDFILTVLGIMIEKRMRILVVIQLDAQGKPVTDRATVMANLSEAIKVFKKEANVRLLPVGLGIKFTSAFQPTPKASTSYIHVNEGPSYENTLDVSCGADGFGQDLLTSGSAFKLMVAGNLASGARRLTGYGAPVFAFAVRSFTGTYNGCSYGPLTDYVTVLFHNMKTTRLAHELGHACYLWHVDDPDNLMYSSDNRLTELDRFQAATLRASRHVTFF
jgi:hypothetical protein